MELGGLILPSLWISEILYFCDISYSLDDFQPQSIQVQLTELCSNSKNNNNGLYTAENIFAQMVDFSELLVQLMKHGSTETALQPWIQHLS